ncbi:MAG: recombinase RecT [Gemmatimonadaceae bacterium]
MTTAAARPVNSGGAQASTAVQRHQAAPAGTALTVVEQKREAILAAIDVYAGEMAALAPHGVTPAQYVAELKLYLMQNPKVLDCTPLSIATGMLRLATTGLVLGESCDLLPFGSTCQFSPRYNGLVDLALAAGCRAVNADVVREGDYFEWEKGTNTYLKHKRQSNEKAEILYAYAVAEIKAGSFVIEVIPREHIEATRARYSKQWKEGALETIPWYGKKTAIRRLSPLLPKNRRFAAALQFAEEVEAVEVSAAAAGELPDPVPAPGDVTPALGDGSGRQFAPTRTPEEMASRTSEIYEEPVAVRGRMTQRPPDTTSSSNSRAELATEEQTERLLDLVTHVCIPEHVREKVKARLSRGLPRRVAPTWIETLEQEIRKHTPAPDVAADGDDDLGLGR